MFGIGGGELLLIIIIALMLFGANKIPDIARMLGKGMAQIKNATNDIKSEISKASSSDHFNDFNVKSITSSFQKEVNQIKDSVNSSVENNTINQFQDEIELTKLDFENITGPIKRQK